MKNNLKKVSMNLNNRSLRNIENIQEITSCENKTRAVSLALELAKRIITDDKSGTKFYVRDKNGDERKLLFLV